MATPDRTPPASDKPTGPYDTAAHNSPVLSEFVAQHLASRQRDIQDAQDDRTYPGKDQAGMAIMSATSSVDSQILALAKAGKPIPQSLIDSAVKLHTESSANAQQDKKGDNTALAQDTAAIGQEQAAINSDYALIRSGKIDPSLMRALQADIASKQALARNDRTDYQNESEYIGHDRTEIAANDRVLKALKGNHADLIPALQASIVSKSMTLGDRQEDAALEPRYATADDNDVRLNDYFSKAIQDHMTWNQLYKAYPTVKPTTGATGPRAGVTADGHWSTI